MKKLLLIPLIVILVGCSTQKQDNTNIGAELDVSKVITTVKDKVDFSMKVVIDEVEYDLISEEDFKAKYDKCRNHIGNDTDECHRYMEDYVIRKKNLIILKLEREEQEKLEYYDIEFDIDKINLDKDLIK